MKKVLLSFTRLFFRMTSRVMPALAVRTAARMFTTPQRKRRYNHIETEMLCRAVRFTIPYIEGLELAAYRWGDPAAPVILFVHGWTGSATSFVPFIEPLVEQGFQVVAYDGLAHGASPGKTANLIEWTETVIAVMNQLQQVHCIIGHSLGGGAVLIASSAGLKTNKIILIAPLADIVSVTEAFARYLSIPGKTIVGMRDYIAKKFQPQISKYGSNWSDIFQSNCKVPTLILHDKNDKEVQWENGKAIAEQWPWAEFITTNGLGHRRILRDAQVVSYVSKFVSS